MTSPSLTLNASIPPGIDAAAITTALDRHFKSQGIVTTVKLDASIEIELMGLSIPNPDPIVNTIKQVLGKLQISADVVKVAAIKADALEPSWAREISIEPIAKSPPRSAPTAPASVVNPPTASRPANHMSLAILATFIGVWPLGVVAIINASQANSRYERGDTIAADRYADQAKRLSIISLSISGVVAALVFLAIILPLFLGGGSFRKIKQEKAAVKYLRSVVAAKVDEIGKANANNNPNGFSTDLNPPPPSDIDYKFEGEKITDMGQPARQHLLINVTPTKSNLESMVVVVYTIDNGSHWFVKSDGCVSKSRSFYPPTATITNGSISCSADSTLVSQQE